MGYEKRQNSVPDSPVVNVGIGVVVRHAPGSPPDAEADAPPAHEILITRRPSHTVYGGWWELPGGKLESGESVEAGVRRELLEECGVHITPIRPLSVIEHVYDHAHVRLHPLLCTLAPDSPPPRNLQVAEHRWCPLADLAHYRFPEANEHLIAELRRIL